jgi:hypothetical protein
VKNKYAMTDIQVESFARDMVGAVDAVNSGRTTYLRVLVTQCQATLGKVKRGKTLTGETQLSVLGDVADRLYAAVLRGITTPEIAPEEGLAKEEATRRSIERNKRSTFARSAKSVLASWINAGGDIRALNVDEVTRDPLMAQVRETKGQSNDQYRMDRNIKAILRLVRKEAKRDIAAARADLAAMVETLETALDDITNGNVGEPVSDQPSAPRNQLQGHGPGPRDVGSITTHFHSIPLHKRAPRPGSRVQG